MTGAYFAGDLRDDDTLLAYVEWLGNRTVCRRLGYLIERLGVPAPELMRVCQARQSAGRSLLDPALPPHGRILRRGNVRVNASGAPLDEAP